MTGAEPILDIAHLDHVELLTPKPEEQLRFFVEVMGMTESGWQGNSVYLPHLRHQLPEIISLIRLARRSIWKGLLRTCMPGSSWPLPRTAFSA